MLEPRAKPIDHTDVEIQEAAYALAKAKTVEAATDILREIPSGNYAALMKHMREHPNLFLPEVRAVVAKAIDAPSVTKAEALFS